MNLHVKKKIMFTIACSCFHFSHLIKWCIFNIVYLPYIASLHVLFFFCSASCKFLCMFKRMAISLICSEFGGAGSKSTLLSKGWLLFCFPNSFRSLIFTFSPFLFSGFLLHGCSVGYSWDAVFGKILTLLHFLMSCVIFLWLFLLMISHSWLLLVHCR